MNRMGCDHADRFQLSIELMVTVASLKSAIAWIWTWECNKWFAADGPLVVWMSIAAVNVVVYLSTFIFYFRGKRIRIWLAKTDLLGRVGVGQVRQYI